MINGSVFFSNKRQHGICKPIKRCSRYNEIFWPRNNQCYTYLTRGPCPYGKLLTLGPDNVAVCQCNHKYEMRNYWSPENGCYEHFTRGPCRERGHLFLPNRTCGCYDMLPHYHDGTQQCYEIGKNKIKSGYRLMMTLSKEISQIGVVMKHVQSNFKK